MSQPTNDQPEPQASDAAHADERLLLTALARLVLGHSTELHFANAQDGAMLSAVHPARAPWLVSPYTRSERDSPRLFLDRPTAAVYLVPRYVADLQQMAQLVADPRRRVDLEVVWREPTRPAPAPHVPVAGNTVTVVMTETIVFRHTFSRAELAELLHCTPADVERQIAEHGDDDDVWLRETLAEHYSHTSDRTLSVEVTS